MPFLLAEILNFQGSTHLIGVGSFSYLIHAWVIYKSSPSFIWNKLLGLAGLGGFGELLYTVIAIFYVFLVSLLAAILIAAIKVLIKKGLNLHRE